MNRVFISYSRRDETLLQEFSRQLAAAKGRIDYWYDRDRSEGIQPGEAFPAALQIEVQRADIFCIFLTSYWTESTMGRAELNAAVQLKKPIVPIQVRKVVVPPEADSKSRLPNSDTWIGSLEQQGERDAVWYTVVDALTQMNPQFVRTPSGPGSATRGLLFRTVVRQLAACKRAHDVVHELLEGNLAELEDQASILDDMAAQAEARAVEEQVRRAVRLAGLVFGQTGYTAGQLQAIRISSVNLLEDADVSDMDSVLQDLSRARTTIGEFYAKTRTDYDFLVSEVIGLKSSLQRSLAHFGRRIGRLAGSFDPIRYVNSLPGEPTSSSQDAGSMLDERWAKDVAARHYGKLLEHVLLQDVYDRVVRNIPNVTRFRQFQSDWKYVRGRLSPFIENWRAAPMGEDANEMDSLRGMVVRVFDGVTSSLESAGDAWSGELTRTCDEFMREFGAYFLRVDKALKEEYEHVDADLR